MMRDLRRLAFPTTRSLKRWESERTKGPLRFVLFKGVVLFGGLMYIALSIIVAAQKWGPLPVAPNIGGGPLLGLAMFVVGGLGWGALTWFLTELTYASHQKTPIRF